MPARVSCHVDATRDTLTAFMHVRAVKRLMDALTDSSSGAEPPEEARCCLLKLQCLLSSSIHLDTALSLSISSVLFIIWERTRTNIQSMKVSEADLCD